MMGLSRFVPPALAFLGGLIALAGFVLPLPWAGWTLRLVQWSALLITTLWLGAGAYFLLAYYLAYTERHGPVQRSLTLWSAVIVFALVVVTGSDHVVGVRLYELFILPVSTWLLGLVAVVLTYRAVPALLQKRSVISITMAVTFMTMLLFFSLSYWMADGGLLQRIWQGVQYYGAAPALRGILLGVAIGILFLALRVLLGVEQPYGEHEP